MVDFGLVGPLCRVQIVRESSGAVFGISSDCARRSAVTALFIEGEHVLAALGVRVLQASSVLDRVSITRKTDLAVLKEVVGFESIRRVGVSATAFTRAAGGALGFSLVEVSERALNWRTHVTR